MSRLRNIQCQHCGADCQTTRNVCWMCRHKPLATDQVISAEVIAPPPFVPPIRPPPKFAPQTFNFSLASIFAVITFVAVGLGLAQIEPGLAMLFGFICFPAFVITLVRTRAEQRLKGRQVGWGEKIFTFIVSTFVVFGTLAIALVALVIALFIVCLLLVGGAMTMGGM